MKAIILAGGKGTRLLPLTEHVPKALIPIGQKTLIEHVLDRLPENIDTVIITIKYLGQLIEQKIGNSYNGKGIKYATQPADQNGTWPALFCTKEFIQEGEHFLVLNCDDLFDSAELSAVVSSKRVGMGVTKTIMPAKYHGIRLDKKGFVEKLHPHSDLEREAPIADLFANGLFLFDATVFLSEPVVLTDNEYGLPQTVLKNKNYPLFAHKISLWQPCNSPEDIHRIQLL